MPTFGSLFSGIGGMDLGLEWAGWVCKWQVEIDDWRRQVLTRHWPEVPKWKDVRDFPNADCQQHGEAERESRLHRSPDARPAASCGANGFCGAVDLICAGVPCQDVSVAGRRAGLAGERTGLFFEFARILRELQPRWFLFENVPGLLSSNQGLDFAVILDTLDECGYGVSWRILNSQFFGVPQRRRRVFIVGHLGGPCPPEILFESEGGGGHPQTGGKTGEGLTSALRSGPPGTRRDDEAGLTTVIDGWHGTVEDELVSPLCSKQGKGWNYDNSPAIAFANRSRADGKQAEIMPNGLSPSLTNPGAGGRADAINVCAPSDPDGVRETTGDTGWLGACTRCPDGRRYAALGDAVTAVVAGWIGRRILNSGWD